MIKTGLRRKAVAVRLMIVAAALPGLVASLARRRLMSATAFACLVPAATAAPACPRCPLEVMA
jgi:hypothetical protein